MSQSKISRILQPTISSTAFHVMGFLNKLKDKVNKPGSASTSTSDSSFSPPQTQPLGPQDIVRYRKQRGVNLGSWFTLERWICNEVFSDAAAPGQSDFDVARGKNAKGVLEHHWDTWITDEDWKWIKERGFNSVRLPVSRKLVGRTDG